CVGPSPLVSLMDWAGGADSHRGWSLVSDQGRRGAAPHRVRAGVGSVPQTVLALDPVSLLTELMRSSPLTSARGRVPEETNTAGCSRDRVAHHRVVAMHLP